MLNLEQLKILAQLVENINMLTARLEKAYNENNSESFNYSKNEMLYFQKKISEMIK